MASFKELIFRDSRNILRFSLLCNQQVNMRSNNYQRFSLFCSKSSNPLKFQCPCKRSFFSSSIHATGSPTDSKNSQLNQNAETSKAKPQLIRANLPLVFLCPHIIRKKAGDSTTTSPSEPLCTNPFTTAELQGIQVQPMRRTSLLSSYMKLSKFRLSGKRYQS